MSCDLLSPRHLFSFSAPAQQPVAGPAALPGARHPTPGEASSLGNKGLSARQKPKTPSPLQTYQKRRLHQRLTAIKKAKAKKLIIGEARDRLQSVCGCGAPLPHAGGATLIVDPAHGSAHTIGVARCKSVWMCVSCAQVIGGARRKETQRALVNHSRGGGGVGMLTVTLRHKQGEAPGEVLDRLGTAFRTFKNRAVWKKFCKDFGVTGTVRVLELTHGENGWHPHFHVLLFFKNTSKLKDFEANGDAEDDLDDAWLDAVRTAGGDAKSGPALRLDIPNGPAAEQLAMGRYITELQLDLSHEATGQVQQKTGRKETSRTLWQLLDAALEGDEVAHALWLRAGVALKGRRWIVWAKGLRERLGIDDELTAEEEAFAEAARVGIVANRPGREAWALDVRCWDWLSPSQQVTGRAIAARWDEDIFWAWFQAALDRSPRGLAEAQRLQHANEAFARCVAQRQAQLHAMAPGGPVSSLLLNTRSLLSDA